MQRIKKQQKLKHDPGLANAPEQKLIPFDGASQTSIHTALPFTTEDYFELVDKTGRIIHEDKRGFISSEIPTIITRLGINPNHWIKRIKHFGKHYGACAGRRENMQQFTQVFGKSWVKGVRESTLCLVA